jgi:hypothetical protein
MKSETTVNWWAAVAVGGLAMTVLGVPGAVRQAQATVINGTTGSNTDSNAYSTTGNLDLSLGFVAEYLVVGIFASPLRSLSFSNRICNCGNATVRTLC